MGTFVEPFKSQINNESLMRKGKYFFVFVYDIIIKDIF